MSAILSSAQALFATAQSIFTSASVQTRDFVLWLFGMESPPADPNLAAKVSRELSEMAGVLEERKTSWICLTVLFGDHKTAAGALTQTLGEVEERIGAIYASKKKSDELSYDEKQEIAALSSALRGHIGTLEEMSQAFPKQYKKIASQVKKIINNAHHLQLSGDEVARIAGDPKVAAGEVIATFEMLIEKAEIIYEQHRGAESLPREAREALEEIRQQVRNRLGIIGQLKEAHLEIHEDMEPLLLALSPLVGGYTGLPRYDSREPLTVQQLNTLPLYARLDAIESRLDTIRWELDKEMESAQEVINRNLTLVSAEELAPILEPIVIPKEVQKMVAESKRLMRYHKSIIAGQIYDAGSVRKHWDGDGGGITPLGKTVPFLEEQIGAQKADRHDQEVVEGLIESTYNYAEERAREVADTLSNYAWSLFF